MIATTVSVVVFGFIVVFAESNDDIDFGLGAPLIVDLVAMFLVATHYGIV